MNNEIIIFLQPVSMRTPNIAGVYEYSNIKKIKGMTYKHFLQYYFDSVRRIKVCTYNNPTLSDLEGSKALEAYSFGHDGWYIRI